jgi:hypothetical protein
MDALHSTTGGGVLMVIIILALAVAIAWILLPFAIFGTKPILRELLQAIREDREINRKILERLGPATLPGPRPPD